MTTTCEITSNAAVYLLDTDRVSTIHDYIVEVLGDYADDFDIDGIEADFRDALDATLGDHASLNGEFIFADVDADLDHEALREAAADIDFWAITERHTTS